MKNNNALYKTIGQVAKELELIDKKTGQLQTHTIRYWEKQFKQIKPSIKAGGRRYYTKENIKIINYIKHLLKDKGLTIYGVKKELGNNIKNVVLTGGFASVLSPKIEYPHTLEPNLTLNGIKLLYEESLNE